MADFSFYSNPATGGPSLRSRRATVADPKNKLPIISTDLDSVRTYQFEVRFDKAITNLRQQSLALGGTNSNTGQAFTLAAKQVTGLSYSFQDIEVHRMNDKVFYPGKVQQEEVTITFDNLLKTDTSILLHRYLATVFDMDTGFYAANTGASTNYKTSLQILEFNGAGKVVSVIDLKGVYPKSFTKGEKNYSNSEFDTIEVKFRYDFMRIRRPE